LEKSTGGEILYKGQLVNSKRLRNKMNYNEDVQMIFKMFYQAWILKKELETLLQNQLEILKI